MDFRKSEATRYIAASVLSDSNLRNEILKCDREKHLADPPEPGIDISLIVKMSKFADNYDNKHALAFFSIFVSMLLIILEYFRILFILHGKRKKEGGSAPSSDLPCKGASPLDPILPCFS